MTSYEVPRNITSLRTNSYEIHVFSDGSEKAYGCVAYLRSRNAHTTSLKLLMSKSRLTPLSKSALTTTPRIELCAAKLGVELIQQLRRELTLDIQNETFWSDSVTVLRYIKNETKRFHRYVSNKVSFTRNFTSPTSWKYVPSKQNPADLVSRGVTVKKLAESKLWLEGPDFLCTFKVLDQNYELVVSSGDLEVKRDVSCLLSRAQSNPLDNLMNSTSSFYKLNVRVAHFIRLQQMIKGMKPNKELSLSDLLAAKGEILKYLQIKESSDVITSLKSNKPLHKCQSLRKLSPFLDDECFLRVGGRLNNSFATYDVKHPLILPGKAHITSLIVKEMHCTLGHMGRESILTKLREKFWILGGNNLVRKIVKGCLQCRKYHGKPLSQVMGELTLERVTGDKPASNCTGLDCFEPFDVVRGRKHEKQYGLIFICLASKAIHLEVLHSLSTDSFINGLRRFICRRGTVSSLLSDNGTNFRGAQRELKSALQEWNCIETKNWLKQRSIEWNFNPPRASHFGGNWERQIRSVRKVLNGVMVQQPSKFNDELLCTLFCEVESILNSRPLTECISDPDGNLPLTPNDILLWNAPVTFPPGLSHSSHCFGDVGICD